MKILLTVGPIPARLDSVKYLTNRFKGGLALKTAEYLKNLGHDVHIMTWKHTSLKTTCPVIFVNDVMDYYTQALVFEADAYILAAAVANLMPSHPYTGKFPSHQYAVGEKFNIEFEIAPRLIDDIKRKHPRSALIGYKLYDGTEEELIQAAKKTLFESLANVVFANHPAWAKEKKIVLTQDGAVFSVSFEEHCAFIHKLLMSHFYTTVCHHQSYALTETAQQVLESYPVYPADNRLYGTFAVRHPLGGFFTTTRGKKEGQNKYAYVQSVDHHQLKIQASEKATLNAPLLDKLLELNPDIHILLHGHQLIGKEVHSDYEFAGSDRDLLFACVLEEGQPVLLPHHGFIVGFKTIKSYQKYLEFHSQK